jgi:hypothetical protein
VSRRRRAATGPQRLVIRIIGRLPSILATHWLTYCIGIPVRSPQSCTDSSVAIWSGDGPTNAIGVGGSWELTRRTVDRETRDAIETAVQRVLKTTITRDTPDGARSALSKWAGEVDGGGRSRAVVR